MIELISAWFFLPQAWVLVAIILVIAELIFNSSYYLVALAIAALLLAVILWLHEIGLFMFIFDWVDVLILLGVLTLISVFALKLALGLKKVEDINKY